MPTQESVTEVVQLGLRIFPEEMSRMSLEGSLRVGLKEMKQKDVSSRGSSLGTGTGAQILCSLDYCCLKHPNMSQISVQ